MYYFTSEETKETHTAFVLAFPRLLVVATAKCGPLVYFPCFLCRMTQPVPFSTDRMPAKANCVCVMFVLARKGTKLVRS